MPQYKPAYQRIADSIREQIRSGVLKPGDKLPSTSQLRAQHGVSEMVVRQAVLVLKTEQLVEGVPGVGVFVANPPAADVPPSE